MPMKKYYFRIMFDGEFSMSFPRTVKIKDAYFVTAYLKKRSVDKPVLSECTMRETDQ